MDCWINEAVALLVITASAPPIPPTSHQPAARAGEILYANDFQKTEVGNVPADFLVLDGAFAVRAENANKHLELPGAPLNTYGALFGPTEASEVGVKARIRGTRQGRRCPVFGIGLNGVGGVRLQISGGKKALEIFKGDYLQASVPYTWTSGAWTWMRLQVRSIKSGGCKVEGKAWLEGAPEPAGWLISLDLKEAPSPGRAALWGSPISGTPIQFDDLTVTAVEKAK